MGSPFISEIRFFAGNFAPKGWAICNGMVMQISQNTALFALIETFYGGNGKSTFALPNLQGNVPIGQGKSSASGNVYAMGQRSGTPTIQLSTAQLPAHTHGLSADSQDNGDTRDPGPTEVWAVGAPGNYYNTSGSGLQPMAVETLDDAGGAAAHNNMMPYLPLMPIIAVQGRFPARS
jgi:microcystin-dependent protein